MQDDKAQILHWKKKYFATLEQLEQLEKDAADSDALFRRSLLRLSLSLDGFDNKLDKQTDKLRNYIRNGRKPLQISQISEEISTLSQLLFQQLQQRPSSSTLLAQLLEQLTLPSELRKQQNSLLRELKAKHADDEIAAHVDTLTILLRAAQAVKSAPADASTSEPRSIPEATTSKEKSGLFSRLFSREADTTPPPAPIENDGTDPLKQLVEKITLPQPRSDQLSKLGHQLDKVSGSTDLSQLINQLAKLLSSQSANDATDTELNEPCDSSADLLLQLLDRITLVDPYAQELQVLREELNEQQDEIDIGLFLERLASLISKAQSLSQNEKQELEEFLLQITATLTEINGHISDNQAHHQQAQKNTQQLDEVVQDQVEGIHASMLTATDLSDLKHLIQGRLDAIRQQIKKFRDESDERQRLMESAMSSLVSKVTKVESESSNLRSSLAQQHKKALRDPLTEVGNRLAYEEFLLSEYNSWKRHQRDLTLVVWDIDHFKKVNDNYGHQAGDKALKLVAKLFKERLRESDHLARYGGEEFVSLHPECNIKSAFELANQLRETIASSEFNYNKERVPLTISCGLATFRDHDSPEQVFQRADAALYQAKQKGRNRCELEPENDTPALGGHD